MGAARVVWEIQPMSVSLSFAVTSIYFKSLKPPEH